MKSQFICVKPKTEEAQEFFDIFMRQLHSCKILERQDSKMLVNSIAGDYTFWINETEDKNWEVI